MKLSLSGISSFPPDFLSALAFAYIWNGCESNLVSNVQP